MCINKLYKLLCTTWGGSLWLSNVIVYFFFHLKIIQSDAMKSNYTQKFV